MRGLSLVTIARSAARAAASPIGGRLRAIAIAAAAEHDEQPAARERAQRAQRARERVGRVRVVDEHQHVARIGHALEAPGRAVAPSQGLARSRDESTPRASAAAERDQQVLEVVGAEQRALELRASPAGVASSARMPARATTLKLRARLAALRGASPGIVQRSTDTLATAAARSASARPNGSSTMITLVAGANSVNSRALALAVGLHACRGSRGGPA